MHSEANDAFIALVETIIKIQSEKSIKRMEGLILELGRPTQPVISRVTSARLISIVVRHTGRTIKGEMVDILKRVINDTEVEVRKVWISEFFPRLLRSLDLEYIELHFQEKIYEIVYEHEEISVIALEVIMDNMIYFSVEEQSTRIAKLYVDSLTSKNEKFGKFVTERMGPIFAKLQNILMTNETIYMKFWKSLIELAQCKN